MCSKNDKKGGYKYFKEGSKGTNDKSTDQIN